MDNDDKVTGDSLIKGGEIILTGPVLEDGWGQWRGTPYISAVLVRDALSKFAGDVVIRLNSGGGDAYEGEAIRAAIHSYDGQTTIVVEGIAASAASLLLMGADRIEMSAGSMLMIHDPTGIIMGNGDDMLKEAERLSRLADVYATVYAARSEQDASEVRELMRSETWLSPDEALESGYADHVVAAKAKVAINVKAAMTQHKGAVSALQSCFDHFKEPSPAMGVVSNAGETSSTTANRAVKLEGIMPPKNLEKLSPAGGNNEAKNPIDAEAVADDAVKMERKRARDIRNSAAPFLKGGQLMAVDVESLIDEGITAEAAASRMMSKIADHSPVAPARVVGGQDETDTRVEAMIGALMHSVSPGMSPLKGAASEYRGLRPKSLAMHLAGGTPGFSEHDVIRTGLRSTSMMGGAQGVSDFSYITTEVMNRTLQAAYQQRSHSWRLISRQRMASDFRELNSVRVGGDFELLEIEENGEYKQATIVDEAEGLRVVNHGRMLTLTFEAIVNDDLGYFERIPMEFARASATLEARLVWGILRDNAKLKSDNLALFHANHGNLAASGGAISVDTIQAARSAMWRQKALGAKAKDEFLEINGNMIVGPDALEVAMNQFVADTTPTRDSETNPYKSMEVVVTPNLGSIAGGSDTAWYLIDRDFPPVEHAYMEGYTSPTILRVERGNPDNVCFMARHMIGVAAHDFRGAFKNSGA